MSDEARPSPEAPPVTKANFPATRISMSPYQILLFRPIKKLAYGGFVFLRSGE